MPKALLTCAVACVLAACASAPPASGPLSAAATPPGKAPCVGAPAASRLPQSGCGPGQTYSQDDIQSTGLASTPAEALQNLDPVVHH
jgi:hypothetical protein